MKKALTILILSLVSATCLLQAQSISAADSAVFNKLLASNQKYHSLKTIFRHELIKKNSSQMRFGTLYYEQVSPNKKGDIEALISMLYDTPKGEYYIINKTNLYNGIDGHKLNFSYRFVPLMKLLGNAVAWAMNGDIYSICSNLQTDYTLTSDANYHIVALTVKKGKNKGITRMLMKYSKKTGLIEYLEIEEKLGITHKYSMGLDNKGTFHQPQINATINASVFTLN